MSFKIIEIADIITSSDYTTLKSIWHLSRKIWQTIRRRPTRLQKGLIVCWKCHQIRKWKSEFVPESFEFSMRMFLLKHLWKSQDGSESCFGHKAISSDVHDNCCEWMETFVWLLSSSGPIYLRITHRDNESPIQVPLNCHKQATLEHSRLPSPPKTTNPRPVICRRICTLKIDWIKRYSTCIKLQIAHNPPAKLPCPRRIKMSRTNFPPQQSFGPARPRDGSFLGSKFMARLSTMIRAIYYCHSMPPNLSLMIYGVLAAFEL